MEKDCLVSVGSLYKFHVLQHTLFIRSTCINNNKINNKIMLGSWQSDS